MALEFVQQLSTLLKDKDYATAETLLKDPANLGHVETESMEVILEICESGLNDALLPKSIATCSKMLNYACENINPRLGLVGLLEQAEANFHSEKFAVILEGLGILYPRHSKKTYKTYGWLFDVIRKKLQISYQFPEKYHNKFIEGKEALLLEQQPEIQAIIEFYKNLVHFFKIIITDFETNRNLAYGNKEEDKYIGFQKQGDVIRDYLVDFLGPPLVYMDLSWNPPPSPGEETKIIKKVPHFHPPQPKEEEDKMKKIKTESRLVAEAFMELIAQVNLNSAYFINWADKMRPSRIKIEEQETESEEDKLELDFVSVGNYFYLVYAEELCISSQMPMAYAPDYILRVQLPLINALMDDEHKNSLRIFKGVRLAQVLIESLREPLDASYLINEKYSTFVEKLNDIIVYCELKEVRQLAIQVLKSYFWIFDSEGRYLFIKFMMNNVKHSGLLSFMIGQLKDCIRKTLDSHSTTNSNSQEEDQMKLYFLGDKLAAILREILSLPNTGPTTDLMEFSDQIIGSLNLLIYVFLRDKTNETGIKDQIPVIETNLLKPLRTGLDLSIAHYQLKMKEMNDPGYKMEVPEIPAELQVMFNNQNEEFQPEQITLEDQKKVIHGALSTFDLMGSLLGRVNECISISIAKP